jgi:hypothetical protein
VRRTLIIALFVCCVSMYAFCLPVHAVNYMAGLSPEHPMEIDKSAGQVRILAELQPKAFKGGWFKSMPGYHAVVWKKGKAANQSLLAAYSNDAVVHDAIMAIGAKPGNNLTMNAWEKRYDKNNPAPDTRVEGTPVDVLVWWNGLEEPKPLESLLVDPGGKGVDLRFGGNRALIPKWNSGCIVCLQSCPGGKVSNRAYTIRDYVNGKSIFKVNEDIVPKGKRKAVVIFKVKRTEIGQLY